MLSYSLYLYLFMFTMILHLTRCSDKTRFDLANYYFSFASFILSKSHGRDYENLKKC